VVDFRIQLDPTDPRQSFSVEVVRRLQEAGFTALWAGGCVRDLLLGWRPTDYDVATDARPRQVRRLFRDRTTVMVGASFGVVVVVGPPGAGQVDVATFRTEEHYSDGRHPDRVHFSTPEQDAKRRDFTVNGMFYDPVQHRLLDFVGGLEDLERRVVRAIGDPFQRFAEDKLRMLRAVRFAAALDFELDPHTAEAVKKLHADIRQVSAERIADELRKLLVCKHRRRGVELCEQLGLLGDILPEVARLAERDKTQVEPTRPTGDTARPVPGRSPSERPERADEPHAAQPPEAGRAAAAKPETEASATAAPETAAPQAQGKGLEPGKSEPLRTKKPGKDEPRDDTWTLTLRVLDQLHLPSFELAFAALLLGLDKPQTVRSICRRLRLSNDETDAVLWLWKNWRVLLRAPQLPLAQLKPLLAHPRRNELLELAHAVLVARGSDEQPVEFCRQYLRQTPRERLDPPPLLTGDDLIQMGLRPSPLFGRLLRAVREAQLNEQVESREQAVQFVQRLLQEQSRQDGERGPGR